MKVKVIKYIGNYFGIETQVNEMIKIISKIRDELNYNTYDVEDTLRMLKSFDVFYDVMKRKFKHFISPRKSEADLIKGKVLVDKLKLFKEDNERFALIIFDRRVNYEKIVNIIKSLGLKLEVSG